MSVPFTDFNSGNICDMLEKIEVERKWPIGTRTPNRRRLSAGDRVLFYQGGKGGGKVVASAELASDLKHPEKGGCYVEIKDFKTWGAPVEIRAMIGQLSFIQKKRWGMYFQGGIVEIAKDDYDMIVRRRRRK